MKTFLSFLSFTLKKFKFTHRVKLLIYGAKRGSPIWSQGSTAVQQSHGLVGVSSSNPHDHGTGSSFRNDMSRLPRSSPILSQTNIFTSNVYIRFSKPL